MAMLWIAASEGTKRGPKIRNYVAGATSKRSSYILPSITGNIDSHVEFFQRTLAGGDSGNDSNLLIVFYVQIMPDDFVMQLHRF